MILDQAADLKLLAAQAVSVAEDSNIDAALASVHHELDTVERMVTDFGIAQANWRDQLPEETRTFLATRAAALAREIAPLRGLNDQELAAFGLRTDAEARGRIPAVKREALALREALVEAQSELVRLWIERVWPTSHAARLQVLAHVPATSAPAGDVIRACERLSEPLARAGLRLSEADIGRLSDVASGAELVAQRLRDQDVPDEVVEFWQAADSEDGVGLEELTPETHKWLLDHTAAARFIVTARV